MSETEKTEAWDSEAEEPRPAPQPDPRSLAEALAELARLRRLGNGIR